MDFTGFVDIKGDSVGRDFTGFMDIIEELEIQKERINKDSLPTATIGTIKEGDKPVPNIRVSFIKDYNVYDENSENYNGNKVVVDHCMTDANGKYTVFVEPGIYTIRVDGGKYSQYYENQEIKKGEGLCNEYYTLINGLILEKHEDVIKFYNTEERLLSGFIFNEYDKPLVGAEIIISKNEEVLVYIKTNEKGFYSFALKNGNYDVRMRAPKQPIEIIRNFNFLDLNENQGRLGFISQLKNKSNLFERCSWIKYKNIIEGE